MDFNSIRASHGIILSQALSRQTEDDAVEDNGREQAHTLYGSHSGLDDVHLTVEWLAGDTGEPVPAPSLRRLATGDVEWRGVFQADRVHLATANASTLAGLVADAMNKVITNTYERAATATLNTPWLSMGALHKPKKMHAIGLFLDTQDTNISVDIAYRLQGETAWTTARTGGTGQRTATLREHLTKHNDLDEVGRKSHYELEDELETLQENLGSLQAIPIPEITLSFSASATTAWNSIADHHIRPAMLHLRAGCVH